MSSHQDFKYAVMNLRSETVVSIDGKAVSVQIGMNLTVVGSKEAER